MEVRKNLTIVPAETRGRVRPGARPRAGARGGGVARARAELAPRARDARRQVTGDQGATWSQGAPNDNRQEPAELSSCARAAVISAPRETTARETELRFA